MKNVEGKIDRRQVQMWSEFLRWLSTKNIVTVYDFEAEWRWKCLKDSMMLEKEEEGIS